MKNFSDIVGHDSVKEHLQTAMEQGKLSHAYIFSGESGSGKMMMAECFAAALLCTGEGEKPCGTCISCMQAETHNHPDIIYVTHEKSNIVVDDIRTQIIGDIQIKPFSSSHKIYIVDDAEKMNEQAQNALLKTLEEPPEYAVIILLATNTGKFLQTIMSRCVTLELKPLDNRLIMDYLMKSVQIPDYFAKICASFSGGCLGKAIKYASNDSFIGIRDECIDILKHIDEMRRVEIMDTVNSLTGRKDSIDDYLDLMQLWFRDVMIYKATQNADRLVFADELSIIRQKSAVYGYESLGNILEAFYKVRDRLNAHVNFEVAIEMLLLAMREH